VQVWKFPDRASARTAESEGEGDDEGAFEDFTQIVRRFGAR
jgi:hypothetical protein